MFAFFTAAPPDRVWSALTDAAQTAEYLYGVALRSDWTPGAGIVACFHGRQVLAGEVLCARPPHHLSYLLRASEAPAVYVTWLVRATEAGTVCNVEIDEADGPQRIELENVWLPVLAALQRVLTSDPGP